jgi:hypothetical protein
LIPSSMAAEGGGEFSGGMNAELKVTRDVSDEHI